MSDRAEALKRLREPFPDHQVSKLPKNVAKEGNPSNCGICGGYHRRAGLHLDYVGHAALTDRLLDVDPEWTWEPVGTDEHGLPAVDRNGGLWIRLTVCGLTRLGYGHADGKTGGDAVKEAIGDALRNAGMRFGAALDLWHKGNLHGGDEVIPEPEPTDAERVTDAEWIENFRKRLLLANKPTDLLALQEEANVRWAEHRLSRDDAKALRAEVTQREVELKGELVST